MDGLLVIGSRRSQEAASTIETLSNVSLQFFDAEEGCPLLKPADDARYFEQVGRISGMKESDVAAGRNPPTAKMLQETSKALSGVNRAKEYALCFSQLLDCSGALRRWNRIVLADEPVIDFDFAEDRLIGGRLDRERPPTTRVRFATPSWPCQSRKARRGSC